MAELPPCPASLQQIQHYLKIAQQHESIDIVVSYWARIYALQTGLKSLPQRPDETHLMSKLIQWLKWTKKRRFDIEAITNKVAGQAHMKNYALKLLEHGDKQGKSAVKAFYMCGILYDIMQVYGELNEEGLHNRKYAKIKAAHIHITLKKGMEGNDNTDSNEGGGGDTSPPTRNDTSSSARAGQIHDQLSDERTLRPQTPHIAEEILSRLSMLRSSPAQQEKPGGIQLTGPIGEKGEDYSGCNEGEGGSSAPGSNDLSPTKNQSHYQHTEPTPSTSQTPPIAEVILCKRGEIRSPLYEEEKPVGFVPNVRPQDSSGVTAAGFQLTGPIRAESKDNSDGNEGERGETSAPGSNDPLPTESQSHDQIPDEPTPSTSQIPRTAEEVLSNSSKLPSSPVAEEKPGEFVPCVQPQSQDSYGLLAAGVELTPEQMLKAREHWKYAGCALDFYDVKSAVENLQSALRILTIRQDY